MHVSELGHGRVAHPSDVLQVGQTVEAQVIKIEPPAATAAGDASACRSRALAPDPVDDGGERFPVGTARAAARCGGSRPSAPSSSWRPASTASCTSRAMVARPPRLAPAAGRQRRRRGRRHGRRRSSPTSGASRLSMVENARRERDGAEAAEREETRSIASQTRGKSLRHLRRPARGVAEEAEVAHGRCARSGDDAGAGAPSRGAPGCRRPHFHAGAPARRARPSCRARLAAPRLRRAPSSSGAACASSPGLPTAGRRASPSRAVRADSAPRADDDPRAGMEARHDRVRRRQLAERDAGERRREHHRQMAIDREVGELEHRHDALAAREVLEARRQPRGLSRPPLSIQS